jgi:hypothetical protein
MFAQWDFSTSFTPFEMACLVAGVDPIGQERSIVEQGPVYRRMESAFTQLHDAFECSPIYRGDNALQQTLAPEQSERARDALVTGGESWSGSDFEKAAYEMASHAFAQHQFRRSEISRWLSATGLHSSYKFDVKPSVQFEKPLAERERTSLLIIIGLLSGEAKIDLTKPAKAAGLIADMAIKAGVRIGETTIENHIKKVAEALGSREY